MIQYICYTIRHAESRFMTSPRNKNQAAARSTPYVLLRRLLDFFLQASAPGIDRAR